MDLTSKQITGKRAAQALDRAGLVTNYNTVPFDPRKPFDPSGIRLGTPAVTSRGMGPADMARIAHWLDRGVTAARAGDGDTLDAIRAEVEALTAQFRAPGL
jgi:glycine hydroxymethyltransferase